MTDDVSGNDPLVSVVMPVYNTAPYLSEAIESILGQTYAPLEVVIVDDGSADESVEIIRSYQERDSRIRFVQNQHGGIARARNTGIRTASGELIANMDSDDVSLPERIVTQVRYLQANPDVVALGSQTIWVDPDGDPLFRTRHAESHEDIERELLWARGFAIVHSGAMFRRWAIENVGGYSEDLPMGVDLDLYLKLAEVGRLANLPDYLFVMRRHPSSTTMIVDTRRAAELKTAILRRACQRREVDPSTVAVRPMKYSANVSELYADWSQSAFWHGYYRSGIKYLRRLVSSAPWKPQTWYFATRSAFTLSYAAADSVLSAAARRSRRNGAADVALDHYLRIRHQRDGVAS
jgi:glycosyltransferase involved in cell wall biosynthesis